MSCANELWLGGVAAQYTAQKAAEKHTSFIDFVEELLAAERERAADRRTSLCRWLVDCKGILWNFSRHAKPWAFESLSRRDRDSLLRITAESP